MKKLVLLLLVGCSIARAETVDALIREAAANNPELAFYEKQIRALPKPLPDAPLIPQPLDFPARESLRSAVLDLDASLAGLYLEQFRFVLASTVRLKAIEYQAESDAAACAADSARRTKELVRMLEQRPAAGNEALIERRILEGAALPFIGESVRARVEAIRLRLELNGLLGRKPDTELVLEQVFTLPPEPSPFRIGSLMASLRDAEVERGASGFAAAAGMESFTVTPWFSPEGAGNVLTGFTRPSGTGTSSPAIRRIRLIEDAREKISREFIRRIAASAAAREVAAAIPGKLVPNLKAAAELADRQYRVGALPVNLVLEVHREALGAITTRNEAILRAWRSWLDVELLALSVPSTKNP